VLEALVASAPLMEKGEEIKGTMVAVPSLVPIFLLVVVEALALVTRSI